MSATATKPQVGPIESKQAPIAAKHYFHSPKHDGLTVPNLNVFLPQFGRYAHFRSNYWETADDLEAEALLAVRDEGYFTCEYETPEQRAALERRRKEEEAAAQRGKGRLAEGRKARIAEERERAEAVVRDPFRAH